MTKFNLLASGLTCKSCAMRIKMALEDLSATSISVDFDESSKTAKVVCDFAGEKSDVVAAIESEGYKVL